MSMKNKNFLSSVGYIVCVYLSESIGIVQITLCSLYKIIFKKVLINVLMHALALRSGVLITSK